MSARLLVVMGFVVAIAGVLYLQSRKQPGEPAAQKQKGAVAITVLYSTEKKDWLESATAAFAKENPAIEVELSGKGSLEAMQGLVDGREKPTLWSPADSLVLALGAADYTTRTGHLLVAAEGSADAPAALVITPLVLVAWEDRADVLAQAGGGKLTWHTLHDALVSNRGWPAVGGKPDWGFVKLGHTDPSRSNSGLQALLSMSYEYYRKTSGLAVADLLEPAYQKWIGEIERGVTKFESSTGTFMTDMIRFGPSRYDVAVVYESLAAAQLENAQGRWGNLKVFYPEATMWSDHPIALLQGDWIASAQKEAARKYVQFLRSRPVQEQAFAYGFRPADPGVPVKTQDPRNPFVRLAQYGLRADVPQAAVPPEPAVIRNLITLWSRTVGNR